MYKLFKKAIDGTWFCIIQSEKEMDILPLFLFDGNEHLRLEGPAGNQVELTIKKVEN